ncbi:hypothetical protein GCM10010193_11940 [Kitasatospora atroaurantiaca]|uniref:Uncharacterized protein DUF3291 n=1 Tax=Kitasatospora atroaurantiaca TaxID=285545 RepID=A0A561EQJ7_9ACTN|nr:DUF3291 domain-containing protein [Kitasatospora atroaurantiaca]TWE17886.1 uncharacterized protein DUF3291 [Kitasatospora atroaurantiaca]
MLTLPWAAGPAAGTDQAEVTVLASELQVRSLRHVPGFLLASLRAFQQARKSPGALGATLRTSPLRGTFWTLSAWESREAINAYVMAEPHRTVMKSLRPVVAATVFTTWEAPAGAPPGWAEADRRIEEQRQRTP